MFNQYYVSMTKRSHRSPTAALCADTHVTSTLCILTQRYSCIEELPIYRKGRLTQTRMRRFTLTTTCGMHVPHLALRTEQEAATKERGTPRADVSNSTRGHCGPSCWRKRWRHFRRRWLLRCWCRGEIRFGVWYLHFDLVQRHCFKAPSRLEEA